MLSLVKHDSPQVITLFADMKVQRDVEEKGMNCKTECYREENPESEKEEGKK